ncbi:MAG: class I SAM-dependent methyltransferase [Proteobacteria bacterium]|nr:class I SAM-dependent methyltransferase [Pseudomonadota bacterium]
MWLRRRQANAPAEAPDTSAAPPPDHREWFRSIGAWQSFLAQRPDMADPAAIRGIVEYGCRNGVLIRLLGHVPALDVVCAGEDPRESFLAAGFSARQRAMLETFIEHPLAGDRHRVTIWGHEAVTPFALFLHGLFPKYVGTEYADSDAARAALFPIPFQDITRCTWPDACFDIVLSGDVLEHVSDLDAALAEWARVLRPGGRIVATSPFREYNAKTEVKAVLGPEGITHLAAPDYHGNPADPEAGSLVFQVPGWDIIERCRRAGFADAAVQFWSSYEYGLVSVELAGVLLLDARR